MLVFVLLPANDRTATRTHHYSHIECDVEGCEERSPPAAELVKAHGLAALGWFVGPGQHRCPKHMTDDTPPRGPQYRDE